MIKCDKCEKELSVEDIYKCAICEGDFCIDCFNTEIGECITCLNIDDDKDDSCEDCINPDKSCCDSCDVKDVIVTEELKEPFIFSYTNINFFFEDKSFCIPIRSEDFSRLATFIAANKLKEKTIFLKELDFECKGNVDDGNCGSDIDFYFIEKVIVEKDSKN